MGCESAEHGDVAAAVSREMQPALVARGLCASADACARGPAFWYWGGDWGSAVHIDVRRVTDPRAVADLETRARRAMASQRGWRLTLSFYRDFWDGGPARGPAGTRPFRRVTIQYPTPGTSNPR